MMKLTMAAARRGRRTAVRILRFFADTCDAAVYVWEKSLVAPQASAYRKS
jgi:hypothetical protein